MGSISKIITDLSLNKNCSEEPNFKSFQTSSMIPPLNLTVNNLKNLFLAEYKLIYKIDYIINEETNVFLSTLLYYFLQYENFYSSPSLRSIDGSLFSLSKGLIIIGGTGVGKTSTIKTFYSIFKRLFLHSDWYFRYHNSCEIITEYEGLESALEKKQFFDKFSKGYRYFDDVKNERIASNFGKINLFEEILYQRHENNARTIITSNYSSEAQYDFNLAIDEFGVKYGYRNFDRILQSFNFIELKGKSLRF